MHILLYSRPFFPAVGGVESVSLTLAEQIVAAGHVCTVVTETESASGSSRAFSFAVERRPSRARRLALVRAADLVHSNGASVALFPYAKIARKPFIWTHVGYQLVSVDGQGWLDGAAAPLQPFASLRLQARTRGLSHAAREAMKLGVRNVVGRLVDRNVAITRWVAMRQPLPRQTVIYNPFSLRRFAASDEPPPAPRYDFVYVGRLVSEKGLPTLLRALALVNARPGRRRGTLLIVGDGERRATLEASAHAQGLDDAVHFAGTKRDAELVAAMRDGAVGVVPSEWEEAMGGVALELLATGRPLIVSERGGLVECVGDAAWTFPNGDAPALAGRMAALLDDEALRHSKDTAAKAILPRFDEASLTREYLDLYADVLRRR